MDNFYMIIVGILFVLAISDLIVGVSNDAVNFLNSAIGSKAAPRYIIMIISSIGIIIGTTFSSGMMEVARKGIFHPENFYFSEIMIIFLAVMLTDIILLDTFNTLGLPTSTTVSIVFELLGAAVAVAIIKVSVTDGETILNLPKYINSAKAMLIIGGILLSVVVAFAFGALAQLITRLIFSFNYKKPFKYFGSIWGAIAITSITYFIVIKGAKGSSFNLDWIKDNAFQVIIYSFIGWTIILQLLTWFTKINILKLIILVGTFALAMAFAGNDLVNFIGVPLAGLKSFQSFIAEPGVSASEFSMEALTKKVQTDTYLLIIAGLIMVITLWLSRKARTVTQTEINLARQDVGDERFGSSIFSRLLVRRAISLSNGVRKITPKAFAGKLKGRFDTSAVEKKKKKGEEHEAFDLIRASVNLTIASIIISFATSLKLPLSTTYVTFMVAMGTSLADKAWGRESAVYRITGVITVIGGWFITALSAFTVALTVAFVIHYGGSFAIGALLLAAIYFVFRTHKAHKKKESEKQEDQELYEDGDDRNTIIEKCTKRLVTVLNYVIEVYNASITNLASENRKEFKKVVKDVEQINKQTKKIKNKVYETLDKLHYSSFEDGHYYVQVTDYLREIAHSITHAVQPSFEHLENHHKGLTKEQAQELNELKSKTIKFLESISEIVKSDKFSKIDKVIDEQKSLLDYIDTIRKSQVKRIKKKETGTKVSILYLNILNETKNMVLQSLNLLKAQRDFINSK